MFGYIYCYVTITFFCHFQFITSWLQNAQWSDEYSVYKINPDIHLMCELHVTENLYRAACILSDADSHFFPNQRNSCSCSLLMSVPLHKNIYVRILGYQGKIEVGNLWEFDLNLISNNICAFLEIFCEPRSLNMKSGTRRKEEKLYWLENDVQAYALFIK